MDPERRAEEIAASYDVVDGPNDEGEPNVEQRNRQQRNEQKGCVLAEKDAFLLAILCTRRSVVVAFQFLKARKRQSFQVVFIWQISCTRWSGEMFTRPGILVDAFPSPYPNEEARSPIRNAKFARIFYLSAPILESLSTPHRPPEKSIPLYQLFRCCVRPTYPQNTCSICSVIYWIRL